jgi:DNA-directed RNA polymerase subunit beta'
MDKKEVLRSYNIPVGAHIVVNDHAKIEAGQILVKIPRAYW